MLLSGGLVLVGIIVALSMSLYCLLIAAMWRHRKSSCYKTFFYRTLWNESFLDLFCFIFFLTTMYTRCFDGAVQFFLSMNRFQMWTKFVQISQEHIMYMQIMTVVLTLGGRLLSVCFPLKKLSNILEKLERWQIFILQAFLPTVIVFPLYFMFDFQYGLKGITKPLLLSTLDPRYDKYIFGAGLSYRVSAFILCLFGYATIFWKVRRKTNDRKRNDLNILIHAGCLLLALGAVLFASVCRRFQIGESFALMRLFFFTTMLWIPCTNVIVTLCAIASLRQHALHPFTDQVVTSVIPSIKNER
ncbi:unnamed protein product [Cylicocyclus nassatus]|uniref:Serpentine receptor class gamma n=1 Tax=Cylicocyclus nassatus TaxID=53992 RepID=A0AA36H486_CYLNA|nr:unnamed protein product [Cylicocyclus nassatus]